MIYYFSTSPALYHPIALQRLQTIDRSNLFEILDYYKAEYGISPAKERLELIKSLKVFPFKKTTTTVFNRSFNVLRNWTPPLTNEVSATTSSSNNDDQNREGTHNTTSRGGSTRDSSFVAAEVEMPAGVIL